MTVCEVARIAVEVDYDSRFRVILENIEAGSFPQIGSNTGWFIDQLILIFGISSEW
jgi:hypothetical protein